MLRPSYNEIPQGFTHLNVAFAQGSVTPALFSAGAWYAQLSSIGDFGGAGFAGGTGATIAARSCICVGVAQSVDIDEREAYFVSIKGSCIGDDLRLIPFVGRAAATSGANVSVYPLDTLPGQQSVTETSATADFFGAMRLTPGSLSGWGVSTPTEVPVFGLCILNPTSAAKALTYLRASVQACRFSAPDVSLATVVN